MLSRSVRLYALDLGFTMTDTGAYGNLNGYTTTFKGYDDYHAMFFDVTFPSMESYNSVMAQIEDEEMEKSYKILRHTLDSRTIGIFVRNGSGLIDRFEELSQLVTQLFIQAGGVGNTICAVCKTPFDQEEMSYYSIDGVAHQMHASCAESLAATLEKEEAPNPLEDIDLEDEDASYGKGFFGALIGALAGSIPWAIVTWFGLFVGWIGFLIGYLSRLGYERFNGKKGAVKFVIVLLTSIFAMLLAEFGAESLYMLFQIRSGATSVSILEWYKYLFTQKDYLLSLGLNLGVGIICLLISTIPILREMHQKNKEEYEDLPRVMKL